MLAIFLAAVGQLGELLTRLTSTRTTNLDNLDDAISTRAPLSTALSTAVWDAALKATIQNRARVKVQTGYVSVTSFTTSTGEDLRYTTVTITAVSDITRCVVEFVGGATAGSTDLWAMAENDPNASTNYTVKCTARLIDTTTLRIATPIVPGKIAGRWTVIDYAATA